MNNPSHFIFDPPSNLLGQETVLVETDAAILARAATPLKAAKRELQRLYDAATIDVGGAWRITLAYRDEDGFYSYDRDHEFAIREPIIAPFTWEIYDCDPRSDGDYRPPLATGHSVARASCEAIAEKAAKRERETTPEGTTLFVVILCPGSSIVNIWRQ